MDEKKLELLKQKAYKLMENQNYCEAVEIYNEIYLKENSFKNNYSLFHALMKNQEYSKGLEIAFEYLKKYIQNDLALYELFDAYLYSGDIFDAFILFYEIKDFANHDEQKVIEEKLTNYNKYLSKEQQIKKDEVIKKIKYAGFFNDKEQLDILNDIKILNPTELQVNVKNALIDPNTNEVFRISILDALSKVNNSEVECLGINGEIRNFDLNQLKKIKKSTELKSKILLKIDELYPDITDENRNQLITEVFLKVIILLTSCNFDFSEYIKIIFTPNEFLNGKQRELAEKIEKIFEKRYF
nr:hypothetical protein [uncultured Ligilactobacillus sp.]